MLDIIIIALGKVKESYWLEAANEYLKRLKPYARLKVVELAPEAFDKSNATSAKQKEAAKISNVLAKYPDATVFLLDERGAEMTSVQFSQQLDKNSGPLVFVIGGSLGMSQDLLDKYQKIALSKLTFLHEAARVILLEQIYRGVTIIKGKDYHH
ncbi:MAG: 23S rRNA (pseudouridine(1915)-N(3))-methyltransferase RlmH [Candidatus Falkowbacteria bacterium]